MLLSLKHLGLSHVKVWLFLKVGGYCLTRIHNYIKNPSQNRRVGAHALDDVSVKVMQTYIDGIDVED